MLNMQFFWKHSLIRHLGVVAELTRQKCCALRIFSSYLYTRWVEIKSLGTAALNDFVIPTPDGRRMAVEH